MADLYYVCCLGLTMMMMQFCPTCGTSILCVGHLMAPKPGEEKAVSTAVNVRGYNGVPYTGVGC